ncbi:hypothetical protein GH714_024685 [Hevea brasiliensis]|uniref:SAM domain-containing protein n=1 Tax=Hevea brasiliensis TaxID=3981 RepID=A0A6A6MF71_HEVBR|nr:hypothetical protein GH714_024685 [Hevea brasiliensis]
MRTKRSIWIPSQLEAGESRIRKSGLPLPPPSESDPIGSPKSRMLAVAANNNVEGDEKYSGGEDVDDAYRGFDMENSESPLKEQSPIHSLENLGDGNERNEREIYYNRRTIRARDNHNHHHDGVELSGPSDTDARDYRNNGRYGGGGEDGVRIWLNSIGLGRYAPVFEIHEVDDEVLPMLTLEDLKDMGINAVGSRRKFCAIQKLGKGSSSSNSFLV